MVLVISWAGSDVCAFTVCPGGPLHKPIVDNDPVYLAACTGGGSCSQAAPPTVVDDTATNRAQGLVVRATVPNGFVADKVKWMAEYLDGGAVLQLWEHESFEGVMRDGTGQPIAGPYDVDFGAPGLLEDGTYHYFRVAFRRASDGNWLCWSDRSLGFATTGFQSTGPTAPSPTEMLVEDDFQRPATEPKAATPYAGDGMGPDAVWMEDFPGSNADNQPRIHTDQHSLLMPNTGLAIYNGRTAEDPHSFAEVQFATQTGESFNYAVMARFVDTGTTKKFYQVKAVRQWLQACHLTLFLIKHNELPALMQDPPLAASEPCARCSDYPVPPEACLQIGENDPQPDFADDVVWLRIEVENDLASNGDPKVKGTLAWGCTDGQPINATNCEGVITHERLDVLDPDGMGSVEGTWAIESHDKAYLVEIFRAGSERP